MERMWRLETSCFIDRDWRMVILICAMAFLAGPRAHSVEGDGGLYRRGYPDVTSLQAAIEDYNIIHRADLVASHYAELKVEEVVRAVTAELKKTPPKDKRRRERLTMLSKEISAGNLPKGTLLTFQYNAKSRTRYWHDWVRLSDSFAIILWSGLDENPPGDSEYNDDAYIIGVTVRVAPRKDPQWQEMKERWKQKRSDR